MKSTTFSITLFILFVGLFSSGTLAEPSTASQHEFTRECYSVRQSLRSVLIMANTTAEFAPSTSAELFLLVIQDRLDELDEKMNSMRICKDGFYIRFWEGAGKFAGERAAVSRIGEDILKVEQKIILIETQWRLEMKRLAAIKQNLRHTLEDKLIQEMQAQERIIYLSYIFGVFVFILLLYCICCSWQLVRLRRLLVQEERKKTHQKQQVCVLEENEIQGERKKTHQKQQVCVVEEIQGVDSSIEKRTKSIQIEEKEEDGEELEEEKTNAPSTCIAVEKAPLTKPEKFGSYLKVGFLGKGEYGTCYKLQKEGSKNFYAAKCFIKDTYPDEDELFELVC